MRASRCRGILATLAVVACLSSASDSWSADGPVVRLELERSTATVGQRVGLTVVLRLPDGFSYQPVGVGPDLGAFRVAGGDWSRDASGTADGVTVWRWTGDVAAFETGDLELPAIRLEVSGPEGARTVATEPKRLSIESVLPADVDPLSLEISDLKDPASIPADFGPLRLALAALVVLLAVSGALWWAVRRFGARLARAPAPPDPFERLEPHEWAFRELKNLLDRRLHEDGQVDEFHAQLSRIVKLYLGGRYRIDLLERTTPEARDGLRQAEVAESTIVEVDGLLERCDAVKFAAIRPDAAACRERVDEAYRLVDTTRPAAETVASQEGAG